MAEYPTRDPYYAHKLIRLMIRTCAAQEIGTDGFLLVTVIAHTEDAKRYTAPVTFWNEQLVSVLGFSSWGKLDRARKRAVAAGWLHYEGGTKGRVARYWTTIPATYLEVPDGSTECEFGHVLFSRSVDESGIDPGFITKTGEENEKHPGSIRGESGERSGKYPGSIRGESGEHSILVPIPNPPPLPESQSEEEEEEVQKVVRILRADPYRVNDARTAVERATESGCTLDEILAIATQWDLIGKWSPAQLWARIDRAQPGESPVAHWPPPDRAKVAARNKPTLDPEVARANQEAILKQEQARANRQQQKAAMLAGA
jgi:hypothetical protein